MKEINDDDLAEKELTREEKEKYFFNTKFYKWNSAEKDNERFFAFGIDCDTLLIQLVEDYSRIDTTIRALKTYYNNLKPLMFGEKTPPAFKEHLKEKGKGYLYSMVWGFWDYYEELFEKAKRARDDFYEELNFGFYNHYFFNELIKALDNIRASLEQLKQYKIGFPTAPGKSNRIENVTSRFKKYPGAQK